MLPRPIHTVGKLVVEYTAFSQLHTMSVGLLSGNDPGDFGTMLAGAQSLATVVKDIMPAFVQLTGFHTLLPSGRIGVSGALDPPLSGGHVSSGEQWRSNTLTFSGRGQANVDFGRLGSTRLVVHVYGAYQPTATEKTLPITSSSQLGAVSATLAGSSIFWADYNGIKASVRGFCLQQFNAHTQKKEGA